MPYTKLRRVVGEDFNWKFRSEIIFSNISNMLSGVYAYPDNYPPRSRNGTKYNTTCGRHNNGN